MTKRMRRLAPIAALLACAVILTPTTPKPASAGNGKAVAGAAAGFVMGVIVGRASKGGAWKQRSSNRSRNRTRSSSTKYVRDDATIQTALNAFGHNSGRPDGVFGPRTRAAIKSFQASMGADPTGKLTAQQRAKLLADYAALVSNANNDRKSDDNSSATQQTTATADFLKRLRQQKGTNGTGTTNSSTDRVKPQPGARTVAFDTLCNSFESQSQGRVVQINFSNEPKSSQTLLVEQFCTARSYVLENLQSDLDALGDLDIADANAQCDAFTQTQKGALKDLARSDPEQATAAFQALFGDVSDQLDTVRLSTRVCLGLAYAFDSPENAILTAASLASLGQGGYGELVGEHLALGLGIERNPALAADWIKWTAEKIDAGVAPVVDVEGYDRAPLLRVLAELTIDTKPDAVWANRTTRDSLLLPGVETSSASQEAAAVAFFASEAIAMIKSLETMLLAIGMDQEALEASCSISQEIKEPLAWRVCRAVAYAKRDFEAMFLYDQYLAENGDADARARIAFYSDLGEQGLAKLAAASN
ncbi:peptidoglycan-binding domain-containing protein [Roseibium sp. SCPC15]|uniref:peptidoglycan-binding domain-containing protein n=1 Tax=Roseibium sp. SCP15 TaxID=3141376 RepID=UPI0033383EB7